MDLTAISVERRWENDGSKKEDLFLRIIDWNKIIGAVFAGGFFAYAYIYNNIQRFYKTKSSKPHCYNYPLNSGKWPTF